MISSKLYYTKSLPVNKITATHSDNKILLLSKVSVVSSSSKSIGSVPHLFTRLGSSNQTTDFVLNFKRLRFFPLSRPRYSGETIFTSSLGCVAKFLNKGKSNIKKKSVFLLLAVLLRRILLYSGLSNMHLVITRTPQYFQEIITHIHSPSKSLYFHPFFTSKLVDESLDKQQTFDFKYVSFIKTKSYGYVKWKKKGRLKRKITKRIFSVNRVID